MPKQKSLPIEGQEALDALWELFSEDSREAVVTLYARMMLSAIRGEESSSEKEGGSREK